MAWLRRAKPEREEALTDEEYAERLRALDLAGHGADLGLRKRIANGAVALMVIQIAAANVVFVWYGDTNGWDIPPLAITGWMTATVVEVISVVLVITRYLFPSRSE